jgi:hypothetical protein
MMEAAKLLKMKQIRRDNESIEQGDGTGRLPDGPVGNAGTFPADTLYKQ